MLDFPYGKSKSPYLFNKANISIIGEPCCQMPIFCLKKVENKYIAYKEYETLRKQFPKHTHALIIDEELEFLENIRYSFRNKAFAHKVFYQDVLTVDFSEFLFNGESDIMFYAPRVKKGRYYFEILEQRLDGTQRTLRIDDSNFFRTMFRKDNYFKTQQEYRIVLPQIRLTDSERFYISPFKAELVKIEDLIR